MALIFNEQFEATDYDETSDGAADDWSETNAGGGTLNKDYSVATAQTDTGLSLPYWGNQCLLISNGSSAVNIYNRFDSAKTTLYIRFDVIFHDISGLINQDFTHNAFSAWSNAWVVAVIVRPFKDIGGNFKLFVHIGTSGGGAAVPAYPYYAAAVDTRYRIDIKFVGSETCEVKINGVSQGTQATDTTEITNFQLAKPLDSAANQTLYYDNLQFATDGWVPDDATNIGKTAPFPLSFMP